MSKRVKPMLPPHRDAFEPDFRTAHRITPAEVKAQAGAMAGFVGDRL